MFIKYNVNVEKGGPPFQEVSARTVDYPVVRRHSSRPCGGGLRRGRHRFCGQKVRLYFLQELNPRIILYRCDFPLLKISI